MTSRLAAVALALALGAGCLAGCAPEPAPTPTPTTPFASDDEAFAAAEKTYRLYVDALNQVDLSDPETFEEVYRWTTGDANAGSRESFSQMHADGWTVDGRTVAALVAPSEGNSWPAQSVFLDVCHDVSDVTVVDSSGASVVDSSRPSVQKMRIELYLDSGSPTRWLISDIVGRDGRPEC